MAIMRMCDLCGPSSACQLCDRCLIVCAWELCTVMSSTAIIHEDVSDTVMMSACI
jgi:hypothetical protein